MSEKGIEYIRKKREELENFLKGYSKNPSLKKILPTAIPALLFLVSATQCSSQAVKISQTENRLKQEQADSSAMSEELATLQDKYKNLQDEFETYKTENEKFILTGKEVIQAQKDEQQAKEVEKAVIDLEKTLAKDKVAVVKQQVENLSNQTKKNDLLDRIQKVQEQITQKESTEKALAEAEKIVKNLEDNQTKENRDQANQYVQGLPDSEQKSTLVNRIAAVEQAIAQKESQEQEVSAPASDTTYYKNCTAVRAAGAAPIYRGQPGYAPHLDRDGDGTACE